MKYFHKHTLNLMKRVYDFENRRAAALNVCKLWCSKPAIVVFQALYKTWSVLFAFIKSRYLIIKLCDYG